jgi:hypothetical protein
MRVSANGSADGNEFSHVKSPLAQFEFGDESLSLSEPFP